jgi:hypothetical protein
LEAQSRLLQLAAVAAVFTTQLAQLMEALVVQEAEAEVFTHHLAALEQRVKVLLVAMERQATPMAPEAVGRARLVEV